MKLNNVAEMYQHLLEILTQEGTLSYEDTRSPVRLVGISGIPSNWWCNKEIVLS
jgi:hypothetical protein